MTVRIGCDIGGTFTDFVLTDGDRAVTHKVLTTPDWPAKGALAGLDALLELGGRSWGDVDELVHGTTLVTNALISRGGVPTALLTTRGFRDILGFGRSQRYDAYNLRLPFPSPFIPRKFCREVTERTLPNGQIQQAVDPDEVAEIVRQLESDGIEAFAVCLLHSYKNPANEEAVASVVRSARPDAVVVTSHQVSPMIREFERSATTAACAYTQPITSRYLGDFKGGLADRGFAGRFLLMQSSGGTADAEIVEKVPIRLLESGPAGGARAAAQVASEVEADPILAFDMGGTTAKACLVRDGRLDLSNHLEVGRLNKFKTGSGIPVYVPTADLIEIGTGGGSIASTDRLGMLQVGPKSAGAEPGPACYGFGGSEPTVTDANLVLGYMNAKSFAFEMDRDAAEKALETLARRLGTSVEGAATGIRRHANENMAAAARMHLVEKGADPRGFTLVASGGAGPLHAVDVAALLGIKRVVVPMRAGVMSAEGFLLSPSTYETATSTPGLVEKLDWTEIATLYDAMEDEARSALEAAGVASTDVRFERHAEMKLLGQVHELTIPVRELDPSLESDFLRAYEERFHLVPPNMPVEVLTWGLQATSELGRHVRQPSVVRRSEPTPGASRRSVWLDGSTSEWPAYALSTLQPGDLLHGPALIDDVDTTTVVGPQHRVRLDEHRNLIINLEESAE